MILNMPLSLLISQEIAFSIDDVLLKCISSIIIHVKRPSFFLMDTEQSRVCSLMPAEAHYNEDREERRDLWCYLFSVLYHSLKITQ